MADIIKQRAARARQYEANVYSNMRPGDQPLLGSRETAGASPKYKLIGKHKF
jgi:hypothetical protein